MGISKIQLFYLITALLTLTLNLSHASELPSQVSKLSIEVVAESDKVSNLSGVHFITTFKTPGNRLSSYFGGGIVYVSLPEEDEAFPALHVVTGINYRLIKPLALNLEFGFDLGEEIISGNDRGSPTFNGEEVNQIDYSLSAGLITTIDKSLYVKTYIRYHAFDGVFLPPTEVTFLGVRLGFSY
ncbi:MAG: hypothetical protein KAQ67_11275 [Gammaproteobacteria bacterium]|nr:hypothetical protein [Gammaproteobacteria bacterium]